ncbi:taurine ABC transporter substrate-binding protein [Labrys wisconsinensis]|uniref:Taurine transport system substrate-binding protein n=1 Tax=Labrys wisconsinensis TaxID=425677 RepID=A0ABU0JJJ6_9HYPH|nr:taurine ABC transporter substrate-binding protein [Labrys wisconsinensis]MDQ0474453.1 taurine transport system substrate-binding protein [Labrys wisconsinensis]
MTSLKLLAAGAALLLAAHAQAAETVRIGYQTAPDPSQVAIVDGEYDKATGAKIEWRKFDSGAGVIAALASGGIDIGYAGSSPLAAGVTRGAPIQAFLIAGLIGEAEALAVRNGSGIQEPKDLVGKKVAVPFVSTTHYSLLFALKHWGIDPAEVNILNLQPPEIAAAFARGDIDATYVWDPALASAKKTGKVLITSAEVAKLGGPTFVAWIARDDFAKAHPDIVTAFTKVTLAAFARYRGDPAAYGPGTALAKKIADFTGAKPEEVSEQVAGNYYPLADEQASDQLLGKGTAEAIAATSAFLKDQKKVDALLPDYRPTATAAFVKAAAAVN